MKRKRDKGFLNFDDCVSESIDLAEKAYRHRQARGEETPETEEQRKRRIFIENFGA